MLVGTFKVKTLRNDYVVAAALQVANNSNIICDSSFSLLVL